MKTFALMVALLSVAGCRSGGGLGQADCVPQLTAGPGSAVVSQGATPLALDLDFGSMLLGQEGYQSVLISNVGTSPLHILGVNGLPPGFKLDLSSTAPLEPGAQPLVATVRFHPVAAGATSGQISLATDCVSGSLALRLAGTGIDPQLKVSPSGLDFGKVLVGTQVQRDLLITNDSDAARVLTFFPIQSDDSLLFRMRSTPPGMLAPHEQTTVSMVFSPSEGARVPELGAMAFALDCAGCQATVALIGQGVLTGLSVAPNPIDFGSIEPPDTASLTLLLENVANTPIELLTDPAIAQAAPGVFQLGTGAPSAGTTILPGASVSVPVSFTAAEVGRYQGSLSLATSDPLQSNVVVPILGTSGGPRIQCSPGTIDFGAVAVGTPSMVRVTCINVGIGIPLEPSTNLFLGIATDAPDFSADYDLPVPLDGLYPGLPAKVVIAARFTPTIGQVESGHLVVTSNDPTVPELLIPLQGSGVVLPPCRYQIQPQLLDFGQVGRGLRRDLQFVIENTGTVDCLVDGVDTTTNSNPSFSLPDGLVASQRLSPAGSTSGFPNRMTVTVRFAPPRDPNRDYIPGSEDGSFNGQVVFSISDPAAPNQWVSLAGLSPDDCLVFGPLAPNLGSVPYDAARQLWCSATQFLTVANLCRKDVTLNAMAVDGGSGFPPDFVVVGPGGVGPWTIPSSLDGGASVPFNVTFRPSAAGSYRETLVTSSFQIIETPSISKDPLAGPMICPFPSSVVTSLNIEDRNKVGGTTQADGGQVDQFTGRGAQVDMLWIVDTTEPISWQFQPADLAPFFQAALADKIDFQMGVTSVLAAGVAPVMGVTQDDGFLEPCDHCWIQGPAATIITPLSVPDPASAIAPLLSIGGLSTFLKLQMIDYEDQFFESYAQALGPDLLTGHNSGFLRPNSVLAVVALGDDDNDQSEAAFQFYYNFLASIDTRSRVSFSFAGDPGRDPGADCDNGLPGMMAKLTGGVVVDASQPGWMSELGQVWNLISDEVFRYSLSSLPADPSPRDPVSHPGGLEVEVDGQPLPPSGSSGVNWHYDALGNAILFEPSSAPPAGALLAVSYALACQG